MTALMPRLGRLGKTTTFPRLALGQKCQRVTMGWDAEMGALQTLEGHSDSVSSCCSAVQERHMTMFLGYGPGS
jgi:hypothetical protein